MALPERMKFGLFLGPFHWSRENPTASFERDMELVEWLDALGYDEALDRGASQWWLGESSALPKFFIAVALPTYAIHQTGHWRG